MNRRLLVIVYGEESGEALARLLGSLEGEPVVEVSAEARRILQEAPRWALIEPQAQDLRTYIDTHPELHLWEQHSAGLVERLREQLGVAIAQAAEASSKLGEYLEGYGHDEYPHEALGPVGEILGVITDARRCRSCGCTTYSACESESEGPCGWAEPDLCTACAP